MKKSVIAKWCVLVVLLIVCAVVNYRYYEESQKPRMGVAVSRVTADTKDAKPYEVSEKIKPSLKQTIIRLLVKKPTPPDFPDACDYTDKVIPTYNGAFVTHPGRGRFLVDILLLRLEVEMLCEDLQSMVEEHGGKLLGYAGKYANTIWVPARDAEELIEYKKEFGRHPAISSVNVKGKNSPILRYPMEPLSPPMPIPSFIPR